MKNTENLFCYGTLRDEGVQIATFGRKLVGQEDSLPGYCLKKLKITDPDVIRTSGQTVHSIVEVSEKPNDRVPGKVFKVSPDELRQADEYEVDDYKRIQVRLHSGIFAWVYAKR